MEFFAEFMYIVGTCVVAYVAYVVYQVFERVSIKFEIKKDDSSTTNN